LDQSASRRKEDAVFQKLFVIVGGSLLAGLNAGGAFVATTVVVAVVATLLDVAVAARRGEIGQQRTKPTRSAVRPGRYVPPAKCLGASRRDPSKQPLARPTAARSRRAS
jgi:hypothetical protein